ncbi:MAG TPA: SRPBCC domain-containing protein, partial [Pseudonocardia sp.]|nr:SRPBCC domain-containing protein [Pseudonocardia sp.]
TYEGDSFAGTVKVKLGPIAMTYKGKGTYVTRDEAAHEVVIEANGRDSRGNGTANATVTASLAADGADRTAVSMVTDMTITGKPAQFGRGVISDVADKIITQFAECVARKLAPAAEEVAEEAVPVAATAAPASEATSDIPAPPAQPARSAPTPAGGSEAISDSVAERTASSNGAAPGAPAATEVEAPVSAEVGPGPASTSPVSTPLSTARAAAAPASAAGGTGLRAPVRSEVDAIDLLDTAGAPVLQRLVPVLGGGLLLVLVVLLIRRLRAG